MKVSPCKQKILCHCLHNIKVFAALGLHRKVIVVLGESFLAWLACRKIKTKAVAMVVGQTILIYGVEPVRLLTNPNWLAHELVHVRQFEKYGFLRFLFLYIWEWVKHGYLDNRYEREARDVEITDIYATNFEEYDFKIK